MTALDRLDPELRGFVEVLTRSASDAAVGRALNWPTLRQIAEQVRTPLRSGGPQMAERRDHRVASRHGDFGVRVLRPQTAPPRAPALLYIHGGGWCLFSNDTHDRLMREYAHAAAAVVVGVDYRLAPEHPFPVAPDQCGEAWDWLLAQAEALGVDPRRIAIGGDSAGGNLSLVTALRLRDADAPWRPRALLLNYGAFDTRMSAQAESELGPPEALLAAREMRMFWKQYLGPQWREVDDPHAVPARAACHGLPPTRLVWGLRDLLAEQSEALAHRLSAAGVEVQTQAVPGAPHSFLEAMSMSALARDAIAQSAAWLRERLTDAEGT